LILASLKSIGIYAFFLYNNSMNQLRALKKAMSDEDEQAIFPGKIFSIKKKSVSARGAVVVGRMRKSGCVFFLALGWALPVFGADSDAALVMSPASVYIIAIIVGILVSLVINRIARANAKVEVSVGGAKTRDLSLEKALEDKLASVVPSKENRVVVARTLAGVVQENVSRKMDMFSTELKSQYATILQEKEKEQEVVQGKYKNLVKEKNQTEAIVQSLAEGLVVVNGKGEVVMMNPAAEKLLGVDKTKKVGHRLTEGLSGNELISLAQDVKGGEKVVEVSSSQAETKKIIRSSSALIENENGQTVGMVSVLTDVTKQRELDRLKSQFVSTVTHELRTPLVATQKALEVITTKAAGPVNDDQGRFLDIAQRNLERLNRLINDILDFSKLEAWKMKMEFAPSSMELVINDVCSALDSWAHSKEILLERKLEPSLPQVVMDPNRVIQVLNNLLSNAIKFTPRTGRVTIGVRPVLGNMEVEVFVEDTGMGIAKEDIPRVFERFLQVGERRQTDVAGTGLGLSIAKEIVELHGGRIWAESEKGQGAKFIFTLPIQPKDK
jgi:two-component system sensor histidine kinase VicK